MRYAFGPLIKRKQAITYIDDTLLQAKDKQEMFTIVKEYHSLLRKANLKAAPDKTMFFLRKVRFLGHVISKDGLSPIASRIDDIRNLKTPESKKEVLRVLGMMDFYHTYILNFHIDAKPLYDSTKETTLCGYQSEKRYSQTLNKDSVTTFLTHFLLMTIPFIYMLIHLI